MHHWGFQALSFWHSPLLLSITCGPSSPLILNTTSSSKSLQWNAPLQPEYVITAYTLHHRVPSLKSQSEMWGPPSTINSVVTDFLGVKLHGGLPWLIFDVGSGPAVVGSNSTRTFNDGQWHTGYMVLFEQASNTFYVTVDKVHMAAITADHETTTPLASSPSLCTCTCPPVTPAGTALQLEWASSVLQPACPDIPLHEDWISCEGGPYGGAYSHSPIPQLEQDVGMGHLFPPPPPPQTGNPGSITEIELSGSAEQDALTMKESPLIPFFLRPHPSWGWLKND
ncbi:hypothetical protein EMCRGX_G005796 [Ephydatia muelleri]